MGIAVLCERYTDAVQELSSLDLHVTLVIPSQGRSSCAGAPASCLASP